MSDKRLNIVVLGLFPPPLTGAAKNNLLMLEDLRAQDARAIGVPTSAGGSALSRTFLYHLRRIGRFVWSVSILIRELTRPGPRRLYFVPDGGIGVWYSLGYALVARIVFPKIFIHHRTFQYIENESLAMRFICKVLRRKATHIMLSATMRDRFLVRYGYQQSLVSTNARYVHPRNVGKVADEIVIGHLSNLCRAKGFFEVVDTFECVASQGIPVRLLLAGPAVEDEVQQRIRALISQWSGRIEYFGPLVGKEKDDFYDRLHVFLFPTKWAQEAQPNVIYEAMAAGAVVIASDRGCIREMIPAGLGEIVSANDDFVGHAARFISQFRDRGRAAQSEVIEHMEAEVRISNEQYDDLKGRLLCVS